MYDGQVSGAGNWAYYVDLEMYLGQKLDIALAGTPRGRYELGCAKIEATYWLLLDMKERDIYVAPFKKVARFLEWQPGLQKAQRFVVKNQATRLKIAQKTDDIVSPCKLCVCGWTGDMRQGFEVCPACQGKGF